MKYTSLISINEGFYINESIKIKTCEINSSLLQKKNWCYFIKRMLMQEQVHFELLFSTELLAFN